jgi:staphyloferrin B biosynthesis citrate synthase
MRADQLAAALRDGEAIFGLFVSTPAAQIVELIGGAGFDFVIIDAEHALVNPETLEHMVRAAELSRLTALVRVPSAASPLVGQVLDGGAAGVVIPRVRAPADAREAVAACRYPPAGGRGVAAGRAAAYGACDLGRFVRQADDGVLLGIMIEDREGVAAIDDILDVSGVDFVLEGAADLSSSLGLPWQTRHPAVREALAAVCRAAQRHGRPFFAVPRAPEDLDEWSRQGVRCFVLGDERGIARRALHHLREDSRARFDQTAAPVSAGRPPFARGGGA